MATASYKIEVVRGETKSIRFAIPSPAEGGVALTQDNVDIYFRKSWGLPVHTNTRDEGFLSVDTNDNSITLNLPSDWSETTDLYSGVWDLRIRMLDGAYWKPLKGNITVDKGVTYG